jgi:beta-glucosidase
VWACENNSTLLTDYKVRLGFNGWVMSDWGATHSTSINQGLDQEMPGGGFMGDALKAAVQSGGVTLQKVEDSVARILVPMIKYGIMNHTAQWTNASAHAADVTSPAHSALARSISANVGVYV